MADLDINLDDYAYRTTLTTPVRDGRISSGFGPRKRPMAGASSNHQGIDYAGDGDALAAGEGTVRFAGTRGGYGNMVEVEHPDGRVSRYGHLDSIGVEPGARVTPGQSLGRIGATGRATGKHLHFEVREGDYAIDPSEELGGEFEGGTHDSFDLDDYATPDDGIDLEAYAAPAPDDEETISVSTNINSKVPIPGRKGKAYDPSNPDPLHQKLYAPKSAKSDPKSTHRMMEVPLPAGKQDWSEVTSDELFNSAVRRHGASLGMSAEYVEQWIKKNMAAGWSFKNERGEEITPTDVIGTQNYNERNRTMRVGTNLPILRQLEDDYQKERGVVGRAVDTINNPNMAAGEKAVLAATPIVKGAVRGIDLATRPLQALSTGVSGAEQATITGYQAVLGDEAAQKRIDEGRFSPQAFGREMLARFQGEKVSKDFEAPIPELVDKYAGPAIGRVNPTLREGVKVATDMIADPLNALPAMPLTKAALKLAGKTATGAAVAENLSNVASKVAGGVLKSPQANVFGDLSRVTPSDMPVGTIDGVRVVKKAGDSPVTPELPQNPAATGGGIAEVVSTEKINSAGSMAQETPSLAAGVRTTTSNAPFDATPKSPSLTSATLRDPSAEILPGAGNISQHPVVEDFKKSIEGRAEAPDLPTLFNETGITPEDLKAHGIDPSELTSTKGPVTDGPTTGVVPDSVAPHAAQGVNGQRKVTGAQGGAQTLGPDQSAAGSIAPQNQSAQVASEPRIYGAQNRLVSTERYEAARERLRQKISPNRVHDITDIAGTLPDLAEIGAYHLEAGAREFGAWSSKMVEDFGDDIKPHLQTVYRQAQTQFTEKQKGIPPLPELEPKELGVKGPQILLPGMEPKIVKPSWKEQLLDGLNAPKNLMSSADLSAPLRQGAILTLTELPTAGKAGANMLRSAVSKGKFEKIVADLDAHPHAKLAEQSGLYRSTKTPDANGGPTPLLQREEAFMSRLAGKLPHVKYAEQAYTAYLDTLRVETFSKYANELKKAGLDPHQHPKDFQDIAHFINLSTGRGDLGKHGEAIAPVLNGIFFSPRYAMSRLQVLNPATYASMTPAARKIAMRKAVEFAGTVGSVLALARAAGAEVSLDPESADFLKIKVGDTRFDVLAGTQQWMRFLYRMSRGLYNNAGGGENKSKENPSKVAERFVRSKLAPVPSFMWDLGEGKTYAGEKFSAPRGVYERVAPMLVKDGIEAWQEEGAKGLGKLAPSIFGIGVSTYADKKKEQHAPKLKGLPPRPGGLKKGPVVPKPRI